MARAHSVTTARMISMISMVLMMALRRIRKRPAEARPVTRQRVFRCPGPCRRLIGMEDLEELRAWVGPVAKDWTCVQLHQLDRELDEVANILLERYRQRKRDRPGKKAARFDTSAPDE